MNWKKLCKRCGECCGPIPFSEGFIFAHSSSIDVEYTLQELPGFENPIPITEDLTCIFYNKKTGLCKIYDERPEVCRLQGTIPRLPCPKMEETR